MRIVDDLAGPAFPRSTVVLRSVAPSGRRDDGYVYLTMRLSSGTVRDGVWTGSGQLRKGMAGGDWDVQVVLFDRSRDLGESYSGPLLRSYAPLPRDTGPFRVLGGGDRSRPAVVSAVVTPAAPVRTSDAVPVIVEVRVTDRGSGVREVVADLQGDLASLDPITASRPISGSRRDGTWRFQFLIPEGSAASAGSLWLRLRVTDHNHRTWYRAPGATPSRDGWGGERVLTTAQLRGSTGALTIT